MMLHLVSKGEWEALPAGQAYVAPSLATEGFIHCTDGEELMLQVANRFYRDQGGEFLLLEIDEAKLSAPVKREPPADPKPATAPPPEAVAEHGPADDVARPLFPHVYGAIDRAAIVAVRPVQRDEDGRFVGFGAAQTNAPARDERADNPLGLKPASRLADELLQATDDFSESLKRYKDKIEARIEDLDRKNRLP
jgi:uncharacterized protein (DUF952 family)